MVFAELHIVPTITNKSKSKVTIFEGNVLYLVCEAKGYPTPSVTWKKNDKVLQTSINKTDFITDDTSEKDAGKYECEASNSAGTVSYTVEVAIKGKVTRTADKCFLTKALLLKTITWYKIHYAGGQAHYYSSTGTLKQRDLNQSSLTGLLVSRRENIHELALQHGGFVPWDRLLQKAYFQSSDKNLFERNSLKAVMAF